MLRCISGGLGAYPELLWWNKLLRPVLQRLVFTSVFGIPYSLLPQETFEDAADSTPVNRSPTDSPSTRSLTGRPASPGSNRTASPELQTIPSEPVVEEEQKEVSQDASRNSSPESPLTSRRISTTSDASLDSVELGGDSTAETPRGKT